MIPSWYEKRKTFIDTEIQQFINSAIDDNSNLQLKTFKGALLYATTGGKKLRAILALEFYISLSGCTFEDIVHKRENHTTIIYFIIALELVHAYSLVHDDLPCMDNDTMRRGQPTVWKKYSQWEATLVGDVLQTLAFEAISYVNEPEIGVKLSKLLAQSIGVNGMIGGQILDIYYEQNFNQSNIQNLIELHNKKTGALIKASIEGAVIISGKYEYRDTLSSFGEKLGLAFQIKDDILDEEGKEDEVGKSIGGEKKGFVYVLGLPQSKSTLKELINECRSIIKPYNSDHIEFLVDFVQNRQK